jgi:hypothetical protein
MGEPTFYWSFRDMAALIGVRNVITVRRMLEAGRLIDPDAEIRGEKNVHYGWLPAEGYWWALDTGRISEYGEPIGQAPRGRPPKNWERPAHWSKTSRVYLGTSATAALMGQREISLYGARQRGSFIPANARIGEDNPVYGWDEQEVRRFCKQLGKPINA